MGHNDIPSPSNCTPSNGNTLPSLYKRSLLTEYWSKPVSQLNVVDLKTAALDLGAPVGRERHRIYCNLLMKLIHRFWNGNKRGPLGTYPWRVNQLVEKGIYRGDLFPNDLLDPLRVRWDRYLGHNIACIAVDGRGEIIDFEFNHNDFFRSSAEHAEARMVRRLFGLADIRDSWRTGERLPKKSRAFSLKDVTLYTSLESCAQCSGVMSLGRVKQVIYLQNDPGAYMVGNMMFNLAGKETGDGSSLAAIPIPASAVELPQYDQLNDAYSAFMDDMEKAEQVNDTDRAFFLPPGFIAGKSSADYSASITSFLCTDTALEFFAAGGRALDTMKLDHEDGVYRPDPDTLTNKEVLEEARGFFEYADVEGFRGSPHKL